MLTLNECNGADKVCDKYEHLCLAEFTGDLIGVQMGIAYGGDVERLAKTWQGRGQVYAYDTFEGHPRQLAPDNNHFEATCMQSWYDVYGRDNLSLEYQQSELDRQGLTNAHLIKGLVNKDSCKELPYINYAFLDMDMLASTEAGYQAVKEKIVKGGYLLLHDVNNINTLFEWYANLKKDWKIVLEYEGFTAVLQKI